MKLTIARLLFGSKVIKLARKVIQYRSAKSDGGRVITDGEKAYLGRLKSEVGEALINMLINERKSK